VLPITHLLLLLRFAALGRLRLTYPPHWHRPNSPQAPAPQAPAPQAPVSHATPPTCLPLPHPLPLPLPSLRRPTHGDRRRPFVSGFRRWRLRRGHVPVLSPVVTQVSYMSVLRVRHMAATCV
jgi:hypothetical protein